MQTSVIMDSVRMSCILPDGGVVSSEFYIYRRFISASDAVLPLYLLLRGLNL